MEEQQPQLKRRNLWLAGIGNLLYPPLGHVYAGQAWRGVLICVAITVISFVTLMASTRPVGLIGILLTPLVLIAGKLCLVGDAALVARQQGGDYRLKWYNRWYVYLVTIGVVWAATEATVHGFRTYFAQAFYIPSGAMIPTLQINDRLVVDKLTYRCQSPRRSDVVVYHAPKFGITGRPVASEETAFIKRVIGEPGDVIRVFPDAVIVDGKRAVQLLDEYGRDVSTNFLGAEPHGLEIEKDQNPELHGYVLSVNGESRVAVTPSGEAELRDGALWVSGQPMRYVGGPKGYHIDHELRRFGAEAGVQGVVYYLGQSEQPALIVIKGKRATLRPGYVSINGRPLKEPYIRQGHRYEMPAYKVPEGYYFVLGDNRNDSNDSHAWGPLARGRIFGVARTIWWPGDASTGNGWDRVGRPL